MNERLVGSWRTSRQSVRDNEGIITRASPPAYYNQFAYHCTPRLIRNIIPRDRQELMLIPKGCIFLVNSVKLSSYDAPRVWCGNHLRLARYYYSVIFTLPPPPPFHVPYPCL